MRNFMATIELTRRGATVVGADISPALIEIAKKRCPAHLADRITWAAGDMVEVAKGRFDHAFAMDSLIYYDAPDIARVLGALPVTGKTVFSLPPRTPLLMAMFRAGKLFPRKDRSPQMVPQTTARVAQALRDAKVKGRVQEVERITAGFYISTALVFEGGRG